MTAPAGFARLPLDADAGFPRSAPLPTAGAAAGASAGPALTLTVVGFASDLAVLLTSDATRVIHDSSAASAPAPRDPAPRDRWQTADAVARSAIAAAGAGGPTLSDAEVALALVVTSEGAIAWVHPPVPGRPLEVRDASGLRGELWVDRVVATAGTLVGPGAAGAALDIAWRPRGTTAPVPAPRPASEGDPYESLR